MTSATSTSRSTTELQRLSVKPDAPVTGFVDGAWWPASRDLAAELPALAAELATRLGRVESVSYNISAWDATPRKITVDGAAVRMAGYRTQDHDTVDVISDRRLLTLLVVPPETDPQAAQDALAAASGIGNTDGVEALLHPGAGEPTSPS
jgi:Family of unknown function (DUF5994)